MPYDPSLPPKVKKKKKKPYRPKKERVRDKDKDVNPFRLSKKNVVMTCRRYGQLGHNVKTYKGFTRSKSMSITNVVGAINKTPISGGVPIGGDGAGTSILSTM